MVLGWALSPPIEAGRPHFGTIDIAKAFESYHLTEIERNRVRDARRALNQDPRPETLKLLEVELGDLKSRMENPASVEDQRQQDYRRFLVKNHEYSTLKREQVPTSADKLKGYGLRLLTSSTYEDLSLYILYIIYNHI